MTRFGPPERRGTPPRCRKSHYDAAEALVSEERLLPAYGHFSRAAHGYRPYITLQKAAAETDRLGWRRKRA